MYLNIFKNFAHRVLVYSWVYYLSVS